MSANSRDPGRQTPRSATSDMGMQCLPMPHKSTLGI